MRHVAGLRLRAIVAPRSTRGGIHSTLPPWQASTPAAGRSRRRCESAQQRGLTVLHHRYLTGDGPGHVVSYDYADELQEAHRSEFLAWKALSESARDSCACPEPLLLSFEPTPTFTLGRRQAALGDEQTARLRARLDVSLPRRREPIGGSFTPDVRKTSRGGLTTYHGPGQLVLWPVIDMHAPLYPRFGVASYAGHLEATTRRLLAERFGIATAAVRDEPGVWVAAASGRPRKIAALGVHHRRHVTALGVAVNIDVPVVGGVDVNPWARFVPCGLEGKAVTSVAAEAGDRLAGGWDAAELAAHWARIFEQGLLDERKRGDDDHLLSLTAQLGALPDKLFKHWKTSSLYVTLERKLFNCQLGGVAEGLELPMLAQTSMEELFDEAGPDLDEEEARTVKALIRRVLQYDPAKRPLPAEILYDLWFCEIEVESGSSR
ncbi:octanoyltransferase [Tolypocladium capitatum]|uniref:Octanoyltransferase n=1 Tax=Tolypocladium capitatum TaxID=45235 RepID=A0A2K3Q9G4_9HYPO|nr:octanoyltransferase [Tolypocladium capitatum]